MKYVKRNFLLQRAFRDLADLNQQARRWVLEQAGARLLGTTREAPLARLSRGQRAAAAYRRAGVPHPAAKLHSLHNSIALVLKMRSGHEGFPILQDVVGCPPRQRLDRLRRVL